MEGHQGNLLNASGEQAHPQSTQRSMNRCLDEDVVVKSIPTKYLHVQLPQEQTSGFHHGHPTFHQSMCHQQLYKER